MNAYYNENDRYVAQWLRNLIAAGHIAAGEVDERSIIEVRPDDLAGYAQCHFFVGIGGWSYALRLAGWPDDRPVWTASCPCQPLSGAGQRKGHADERHLWPAFHRLIAERRPSIVFGEQVASADGREWLAGVRADLEAVGYAVGAADLCAASQGAPHIRQRLYWLADAGHERAGRAARPGKAQIGRPFGDAARRRDARASGARLERRDERAMGIERAPAERSGGARGMANANAGGCSGARLHLPERRSLQAVPDIAGPSGNRHWEAFDLIPCTDGKARRVEPGSFPLVTRLPENMGCDGTSEVSPFRVITDPKTGKSIGQSPWRVGMLRAYGNAIVPQVAAAFISASMEATDATNG